MRLDKDKVKMLNDSALRAAAADLLAAAIKEIPSIGLALEAVEAGLGRITIETTIGPEGVLSAIYFDRGGDKEGL